MKKNHWVGRGNKVAGALRAGNALRAGDALARWGGLWLGIRTGAALRRWKRSPIVCFPADAAGFRRIFFAYSRFPRRRMDIANGKSEWQIYQSSVPGRLFSRIRRKLSQIVGI